MRSLIVAAIQAASQNGHGTLNLANAERLIEQAVTGGAQLLVCPELLAAGYIFDESIWDSAEPTGGMTEQWLARMARKYSVTIGAGYLEAEGDQFWNTFSLAGPTGGIIGRVRKASLPFFEGWFFRPCPKPKIIETEFGRLAVGICNDVQTAAFLRHVVHSHPDLILMPHSAPTPWLPVFGEKFRQVFETQLRGVPGQYAHTLGIPVVMANKVSSRSERTPLPLLPLGKLTWRFRGYSSIWNGLGVRQAELVEQEGALLAAITLDPDHKRRPTASSRGYFSFPPKTGGPVASAVMQSLARLGQRAYAQNERRAAAARRITKAQHASSDRL